MIKAAIFDMDGTLIDTEPFWRQAHMAVLAQRGFRITEEDIRAKAGVVTRDIVEMWRQRFGWDASENDAIVEELFRDVMRRVRLEGEPMPGAVEAVKLCKELGLQAAIASSSPPALLSADIECLGIASLLDLVHSGVDEKHGKPYPDIFLSTAKRLNVNVNECVVFEDSHNGVDAAEAAGMYCIAIPQEPYDHAAFRRADVILSSLQALTPELLRGLHSVRARSVSGARI